MDVYTIGFTKKTASVFFGLLKNNGIKRLVDVRLNNISQLSGFAKRPDLEYFLNEICDAEYLHVPLLAPTQEMLDDYKKHNRGWDVYEKRFLALMKERQIEFKIERSLFQIPTVLLCSEPTAEHCHRSLVLRYLNDAWGQLEIKHL